MRKLTDFFPCLIIALFLIASGSVVAKSEVEQRPKVALVLAGGGAKGAAHIGVLKALEELKVPIDIITGTSMGAFIGGLYATGMSADEIESFIDTVDWNGGYRDRVDRSERRVQDKEYEDRYQLTTDLGLGWDQIRSGVGIVRGQGMLTLLRETVGNLPPFASFDDLVIPYRAVATDIVDLKPVVLDSGYLVDVMMASMSVPGALPPYNINGRLLVDGGVTNNMPVDIARKLGADIVIAVDISTDYKKQEDFTNFLTIADQVSNYLVRNTTAQQTELLTPKDILLRPNVANMETGDFDMMHQAFDEGYKAAMQLQNKLNGLALSTARFQDYIDGKEDIRRHLRYGDNIEVQNIIVNNDSHYSDEVIQGRLNLKVGRKYTLAEIEKTIQSLYAWARFELITYRYDVVDGKDTLIIDVKEKSWGPNYLNFRFFLEDDFSSRSQYSLGLSTQFTDLNSFGTELWTSFEMGTDKRMDVTLYSPLFTLQKAFTTFGITFDNEERIAPVKGFGDTSLESTKNYTPLEYTEWTTKWALGYQDTLWRRFMIGTKYVSGSTEYATQRSLGSDEYTRYGVFANFRVDTLDDYSLPQKGIYFDLDYALTRDEIDPEAGFGGLDDETHEIGVKFIGAHTIERHTLVANVDLGFVSSKSDSAPLNPEDLGGFLNLSGIPRNSLIGSNKVFGSLVYRYRWFDNDFGMFSAPFYVGTSIEYGGVWSDPDAHLRDVPMYAAGSVFVGMDSPVGPVMLGYGRTEQNFDSVYLIIGTTFK